MCEIYSKHWVHKHTANFENIVSVISCLSDSWLKNKQIIYFSLPTALSEMVHWKHVVEWVSGPSWPVTLVPAAPWQVQLGPSGGGRKMLWSDGDSARQLPCCQEQEAHVLGPQLVVLCACLPPSDVVMSVLSWRLPLPHPLQTLTRSSSRAVVSVIYL